MISVFYEIKRVFTTKTVLILMTIIILFSVLTAYGISAISTSATNSSYGAVSYGYGGNGTYHVTTLVQDPFGNGVQGSIVNLTVGSKVYKSSTDAEGYANFTLTNVTQSQFIEYQKGENPNYGFLTWNFTLPVSPMPIANNAEVYFNQSASASYFFNATYEVVNSNNNISTAYTPVPRYQMRPVSVQNQRTAMGLNIVYEGSSGQSSSPVRLYYQVINASSNAVKSQPSISNMSYYGTYSGFTTLNINPSNITTKSGQEVEFALFTPSGQVLGEVQQNVAIFFTSQQLNTLFYSGEMSILGIFIPLMAAVSAYMTFGKDRTAGVIESVLVRPITRVGLMASRYLANVAAVFLAAFISFLASSLLFYHYMGMLLPTATLLVGLWGVLVSIAGFIGLVYLASSFVKSQGALLGFVIGVYFVLNLFWTSIAVIPPLILYGLHVTAGGVHYAFLDNVLKYASPSGVMSLSETYATGTSSVLSSAANINLAQIGVTVPIMLAVGIIWVAVPTIIAVYAYRKRD